MIYKDIAINLYNNQHKKLVLPEKNEEKKKKKQRVGRNQ